MGSGIMQCWINAPVTGGIDDKIKIANSQIEYVSNSIDLNRKDRAKRYHKSSIFNRQYSIPACPG